MKMALKVFPRRSWAQALVCACAMGAAQSASPDVAFMTFDFSGAPEHFSKLPDRAGMTRFSALDAISFEGVAGPEHLVVKIAIAAGATKQDPLLDARVTYRPNGFTNYWQSIEIAPDAFHFDLLELSGMTPRIAGGFTVSLCHRASVMTQPDPEQCQTAQGQFFTDLQID